MERRAFIGETYCCDDGRIEEVCEDEPYDEYGYMENNGDEWEYYDEDEREYFDPKDFKDEIILRWVYGKLRKEWVLGKMKDVSGHLYPVSGKGVHSGALFSLPFLKDAAGIIKKN